MDGLTNIAWLAAVSGLWIAVNAAWGALLAGTRRRRVLWIVPGVAFAGLAILFLLDDRWTTPASVAAALAVVGHLLGRRAGRDPAGVESPICWAASLALLVPLLGILPGAVEGLYGPEFLLAPVARGVLAMVLGSIGWLAGRLGQRVNPTIFESYPWIAGFIATALLPPYSSLLVIAYALGIPAGLLAARRLARIAPPARGPRRFVPFVVLCGAFHGLIGAAVAASEAADASSFDHPETFATLVGLSMSFGWFAGRRVLWPSRPRLLDFRSPALSWLVRRSRAYERIATFAGAVRHKSRLDEDHYLFTLVGAEEFIGSFTGRHHGPSEALNDLFERVNTYHFVTGLFLDAGPDTGGFGGAMKDLLDCIHMDIGSGRYSPKAASRVLRQLESESFLRLPIDRRESVARSNRGWNRED